LLFGLDSAEFIGINESQRDIERYRDGQIQLGDSDLGSRGDLEHD